MTMMTTNEHVEIDQRKAAVKAEIDTYREKNRRERAAREAAALSADEEIAREIRARRADEANRAEINAQLQKLYAKRDADIAAMLKVEEERKKAGNPHLRTADPPARRVAKLLRQHLGDKFDVLVSEIGLVDWNSLKSEIKRIPIDEAAEAKHAAEQAMAAKLAEAARTLPEPADDAEREIMRRHGFLTPVRAAELAEGAL